MFKPINNNVILLHKEENSSSKILFESKQSNECIGIVIAKDEQIKNININDIVLYNKDKVYKFEYDNISYISININDIISIIE